MDINSGVPQMLRLRVLTDPQIEKIIQATLECLDRTGVNVLNAHARDLLARAGARVDGVRVRIPSRVIQDALSTAPQSFTLWGRDGRNSIHLANDRVYFGPGVTATNFVDPNTQERRVARRSDIAATARVSDALPNIDYVMGLGLIGDVRPDLAPVYEFAEMVANTTKPMLPWAFSPADLHSIYQMAVAVAGSEAALRERPFFALFSNSQPPLVHTDQDLANILWAVEHDIPVAYLGGGSAGATAPVTGAGVLVTCLAASLSGLAIIQLAKRGAPVCLGSTPEPMDMRIARPAYGAPEMSLYSAALSDIALYLQIPFMGTAGASEAKTLDLQAAIESTVQVLLSGLSGATLIHDAGFLDCAELGSLELLVMADEVISMTRRIMRGIEVNDQTLMLDLIDRIGPGGEFISTPETAHSYRKELWMPRLMNREKWVNWQAAGASTMHDRIQARLREILQTHQPAPLPDGAADKIQKILQAAEARPRA